MVKGTRTKTGPPQKLLLERREATPPPLNPKLCGTQAGREKMDPRTEGLRTAWTRFGEMEKRSGGRDKPEVEFDVEFLLKQVGAALRVAEIFRDVAASFDFQRDRVTLEGSAHVLDALAMRVIEALGNTYKRGEAAGDALVVVVERRVGRVVASRLRLAIVVTHNGSDQVAIASFQSRDVPIEGEVFAVFVVRPMADAVTDIVEKRSGFQLDAGLRRKMVNGLELIEKHETELANVVGVLVIVFKAAAKTASGEEHLAGGFVVAMRFLAGECFAGDFVE